MSARHPIADVRAGHPRLTFWADSVAKVESCSATDFPRKLAQTGDGQRLYTLNRVAEFASEFNARGSSPSHLYTKDAPTVRRIFDHRRKAIFATLSAKQETFPGKPLGPVDLPMNWARSLLGLQRIGFASRRAAVIKIVKVRIAVMLLMVGLLSFGVWSGCGCRSDRGPSPSGRRSARKFHRHPMGSERERTEATRSNRNRR